MKYSLLYPQVERIYFKIKIPIVTAIYDMYRQFIDASRHNPNKVYLGPKAYNELMEMAYDTYSVRYTNGYIPDLGNLFGMDVVVSSHLMDNDIILLRTIE